MDADLAHKEREVFRAAVDDGLWEVLLATFVSMFAIAPLLSRRMGDFWSSALFVPVLAVVYVVVRVARAYVVVPRVGTVRFGPARVARLRSFSVLMLAVNVVLFLIGLVAAVSTPPTGWSVPIGFSVVVLALLSTAAYFLDMPRLYVYGLLLAAAPLVGEWLFRAGRASHHGFPVAFGACAVVIGLTGLLRFASIARRTPPGDGDAAVGGRDA